MLHGITKWDIHALIIYKKNVILISCKRRKEKKTFNKNTMIINQKYSINEQMTTMSGYNMVLPP